MGLGWGEPYANGAKLARPQARVVCVAGDGGFGHTWAELETMRRLGPISEADGGELPGHRVEDLTAGASGLVVELVLDEPVELLVYEARRTTTLRTVDAVRFTASRPAVLLREASARRLPVG